MICYTYTNREEHLAMTTSRWSKMIAVSTACIITLTSLTSVALARPGRTDAKGGHTCKTNCAKWGLKNGEYHYHHGSSSSSSKKSGSSKSSSSKKSKSTKSTKSTKASKTNKKKHKTAPNSEATRIAYCFMFGAVAMYL